MLGHSFRVLQLSDITLPGGIRYAQTSRLPSGDAFSVVQRVKLLKLPSGDAFSVIQRVKPLKLPSGDAFSVITKHYFPARSTSGFERCARNLDNDNHVSIADAVGATLCRPVAPQGANTHQHKIIAHAIIIDNRATKTMQFITPFRRTGRHKVAPTPFG